jgi:hypothetical protein
MAIIKTINDNVHSWLEKVLAKHWSRHAIDDKVKIDHVTNNLTKSFNGWLREWRNKPILTLLDYLRRKMMKRLQSR